MFSVKITKAFLCLVNNLRGFYLFATIQPPKHSLPIRPRSAPQPDDGAVEGPRAPLLLRCVWSLHAERQDEPIAQANAALQQLIIDSCCMPGLLLQSILPHLRRNRPTTPHATFSPQCKQVIPKSRQAFREELPRVSSLALSRERRQAAPGGRAARAITCPPAFQLNDSYRNSYNGTKPQPSGRSMVGHE